MAESAACELLPRSHPPAAVFAASNRAGIGVLCAVRASGCRADVAGFDEFELADLLCVILVRHHPLETNRGAAEMPFRRMSGG
ncbi:MAG: hypothetical protein WDA71_03910 [Actinomycetota bacterium]